MSIRSMRHWHWLAAGLTVGLLLGVRSILTVENQQIGGAGFISQSVFEECVRMPPLDGKPCVRSIVVHPAEYVDLVTLEILNPSTMQYYPARFASPRPYTPKSRIASRGPLNSVSQYTHEVSRQNPAAAATYAWWEESWAALSIWTIGAGVVIGVVWPLIVRLLAGPSATPARSEPGLLPRNEQGRDERKQRMTDKTRQHLEDLEAEMIAGLSSDAPAASKGGVWPFFVALR